MLMLLIPTEVERRPLWKKTQNPREQPGIPRQTGFASVRLQELLERRIFTLQMLAVCRRSKTES